MRALGPYNFAMNVVIITYSYVHNFIQLVFFFCFLPTAGVTGPTGR